MPVITIFCTFTRKWAIERWIENLLALDYPKEKINLAFIIDIDDPWIATRLNQIKDNYRGFLIKINRNNNPNEVRPFVRRQRIALVKEQSKKLINAMPATYVLGLEDDTVFENLNLRKWATIIEASGNGIGFIEGVQCGRWGLKMIGAWKFDDINNPSEVATILPPLNGLELIQDIDAGGFYGYLIRKENYLAIPYEYNGEVWGADVNAGLWLRRKELINCIDWTAKFGHNDHNVIIWPDTDLQIYKAKKINDQWHPVVP